MKKVFFTIIATIFLGVAADAQTKSVVTLDLSLEDAVTMNFTHGTAISAKVADTYTQAIKTNTDRSFNVSGETFAVSLYTTNIQVPVTKIIESITKSYAAGYIGNSYSISVF